jgi:replicative DNA helicase
MTAAVPAELDGGYLPGEDVLRAERAVLGAAISTQRGAESVADEGLTSDHFHNPAHGLVFEAVMRLLAAGTPVSPVTVHTDLARAGTIQQAGDAEYLHSLMQWAELWALGSNADRLRRDRARRRLRTAAERVVNATHSSEGPGYEPDDVADFARREIDAALAADRPAAPRTAGDMYLETLNRLEHPEDMTGLIAPPWPDLRDLVRVFRPGQLITIGARPGTGKSTFGADLLRHAGIRLGLPLVLFSMEMGEAEVMERVLAAETSVPLENIQQAALTDWDWDRVSRARNSFLDARFEIDDSPGITPGHIRARLRRMERAGRARLAIVDYLQLMKGTGRHESREREIADITWSLKSMARQYEIPVILLAQLNRNSEQRGDRRPVKSDLRESGAIENDSDIVILIHRPDMGDPDHPRPGEAEFIVDKNRTGPLGARTVMFQGHFGRFVSLDHRWSPSAMAGDAA